MNLYRITIERLEKNDLHDILSTKTHNVEANNCFSAIKMVGKLYDKFEDKLIIDIISIERVAKDIIHCYNT